MYKLSTCGGAIAPLFLNKSHASCIWWIFEPLDSRHPIRSFADSLRLGFGRLALIRVLLLLFLFFFRLFGLGLLSSGFFLGLRVGASIATLSGSAVTARLRGRSWIGRGTSGSISLLLLFEGGRCRLRNLLLLNLVERCAICIHANDDCQDEHGHECKKHVSATSDGLTLASRLVHAVFLLVGSNLLFPLNLLGGL